MKIYFGASIFGADGDIDFNQEIIAYLKKHGTVLSEHLFTKEYKQKEHSDLTKIHDRDVSWIRESDRLVMECSAPSLGVGYEIREGIFCAKPILCLYKIQEKRLSAMVSGSSDSKIVENANGVFVHNYNNLSEVKMGIDFFFQRNFR